MAARIKSMSNARMDQVFLSRGENPEEALGRDENVPENLRAFLRDQQAGREQAAWRSKVQQVLARLREIQSLLADETKTLNVLQKGDLVALFTDVGKVDRQVAADVLGLSYSTAGVYKWKALAEPACGSDGRCEGVAGCAHERGAALLIELVRRVLAKLP